MCGAARSIFSCLLGNWLHLMFEKSTAFTFYRIWYIRVFSPLDGLRGKKSVLFLLMFFNSDRNLFSFFQIYFIYSVISWGLYVLLYTLDAMYLTKFKLRKMRANKIVVLKNVHLFHPFILQKLNKSRLSWSTKWTAQFAHPTAFKLLLVRNFILSSHSAVPIQ